MTIIGVPIWYPQSPIAIRDGTWSRLQSITAFEGRVFKARSMPTKDSELPFVAVFHGGDRTRPYGSNKDGAPTFAHDFTLAVDIIAKGASETDLDSNVLELVEEVQRTLLTDASWIQLFEGINKSDTQIIYPKETNFFIVQAALTFEVTLESMWPPVIPNSFQEMTVSPIRFTAITTLKSGSTGDGDIKMAKRAFLSGIQVGLYKAVFRTPWLYSVSDPNGVPLGSGTLGSDFANQIQFEIFPGSTAFAAGDEFDIEVTSSGEFNSFTTQIDMGT